MNKQSETESTEKTSEDVDKIKQIASTIRVLVACEESQIVCSAFREYGFEAYSCDIEPSTGGHPEWHIQGDVLPELNKNWDLIIAFPPCTYLTTTGNRWFNMEIYKEKAVKRKQDRVEAIDFFMKIVNASCSKIAIENPVGIMSTNYRKPDQIVNPYEFGDPAEKRTCLWLKGLPKLKHTDVVVPPERIKFKSGKTMAKWYFDALKLSKKERQRVRSKTFPGIALAMAEQWSGVLLAEKFNGLSQFENFYSFDSII